MFLSLSFSGTIYLSKSLDGASDTKTEINIKFEGSYSIGYHHSVWAKKRSKFGVDLGFELFQDSADIKFLSFYSMGKYKINKKIYLYGIVGMNFYEHDYKQTSPSNFTNDPNVYNRFSPNTKGGYTYGLGITYMITKKVPISVDYESLEASEIHNNIWKNIDYNRCSIQLGYKF